MRVGLNGQYILISDPAGPERFTINLYRAIAALDQKNDYPSDPRKKYFIRS